MPRDDDGENPDSALKLIQEGRALIDRGHLREAELRYEAGLHIDPRMPGAWMDLGVLQKELGRYEEAAQTLRKAVALDRQNGNAWFNLGSLYLRQLKRPQEAFEYFEEALRCNPEDEDAVCFAVEALRVQDRPVPAEMSAVVARRWLEHIANGMR
jgi:tetratricopeptide (TPR) repeat protein